MLWAASRPFRAAPPAARTALPHPGIDRHRSVTVPYFPARENGLSTDPAAGTQPFPPPGVQWEYQPQGLPMADIISMCCGCGSIKNEAGAWDRDLDYRRLLPSNRLSHGICPGCVERIYPELAEVLAQKALASGVESRQLPSRNPAQRIAASWAPSPKL
jgi:hypothetical protein